MRALKILAALALLWSPVAAWAQSTLSGQTAPINVSSSGLTQVLAAPGSGAIHVTAYLIIAGGTANVTWEYGTGTNCGTGTTALSGPLPLTAQIGAAPGDGAGIILWVPPLQALCLNLSAGVQVSGHLSHRDF